MKCLLFLILLFAFLHCGCIDQPKKRIKLPSVVKPVSNKPVPTIGIIFFDDVEKDRQQYLAAEVGRFYHFRVKLVQPVSLPKVAFYPPRQRYRADSLINFLARNKPQNLDRIIGVTSKDISCTNGNIPDWGIFGLGFKPGPSCIISSYRLKRKAVNSLQVTDRIIKVMLHELGHNLGIPHCKSGDVRCFMKDADGKISSVDSDQKFMCGQCRSLIKI